MPRTNTHRPRAEDTPHGAPALELPFDALADVLGGEGRARKVWQALAMSGDAQTERSHGRVVRSCVQEIQQSRPGLKNQTVADCGTRKLLLDTGGVAIESVIIPTENRSTLCLSSQAGCARGCIFCCTATMGLVRNLTSAEMIAQVLIAKEVATAEGMPPIRNVVFMGMGEPLDNLESVDRCIRQLTDPRTLGFGPSHVTLSTIGPSPQSIRRTEALPCQLAWSLHSANDAIRRRLIPGARFAVDALRDAFMDRLAATDSSLFVEVTLVRGYNDSEEEAHRLAEFLLPLRDRVRLNLLRMNPGRENVTASGEGRTRAFRQILHDTGYFCSLRTPRGLATDAACGQLAVAGPTES